MPAVSRGTAKGHCQETTPASGAMQLQVIQLDDLQDSPGPGPGVQVEKALTDSGATQDSTREYLHVTNVWLITISDLV